MEHGITWLSYLPGHAALEHWLQAYTQGILGQKASIQPVLAALMVALVLLSLGVSLRRQLAASGDGAVVPDAKISLRNFVEVMLWALYQQMNEIIDLPAHKKKDLNRYFAVLATLALFILCSNLIGLIPGMTPPTDNWNTTFACGLLVFLYYNFHGLRANGWGYIAHMANPVGTWWGWLMAPLMLPIEIVSHIVRPFSLGVRLAANMMGDHAVLIAFLGLVPIVVPVPFMFLGLLVSLIQTLVFVLLSSIYIGLAVADLHAEDPSHDESHEPLELEPNATTPPLKTQSA